jgi:hypothetical protein
MGDEKVEECCGELVVEHNGLLGLAIFFVDR